MTLVIEERCGVRLKIPREDFRDTPYTRTHSGGFPHTLGGFVLSVPRDATHRRTSQATQFRKVCRSKNSNGRPIPLVKWRTIALVNHYIKILYRPPCSRHLPSTSSPPGRCYPSRPVLHAFAVPHEGPGGVLPRPPTDPYIVRSLRSYSPDTDVRIYVRAAVMRADIGASWPKYKMSERVYLRK